MLMTWEYLQTNTQWSVASFKPQEAFRDTNLRDNLQIPVTSIHDKRVTMELHNQPKIERVLIECRMNKSEPGQTSLPSSLKVSANSEDKPPDVTLYRHIIGALKHLASTLRLCAAYRAHYLPK